MIELFNQTCQDCSRLITERYSTSFSAGIRAFDPKFRSPIYSVYAFVRFADEIVDTFHNCPQAELLDTFRQDTWRAIEKRISLNPVLQAFQQVVHQFGIERALIEAFLESMEMDLHQNRFAQKSYDEYIYGSAEVVGLMCLRVFCEGDREQFERLKSPAQSLGAAFQKINFLRDLRSDFEERGRVYFPGVDFHNFTAEDKREIEKDIKRDFDAGYLGILQLPSGARFGVYLAYVYYLKLFKKIQNTPPNKVREHRIRVLNSEKMLLLFQSSLKMKLNLI
ncbi:MAG: phytoene/squalene synthase family protein [Saprospiraceae bacterium]